MRRRLLRRSFLFSLVLGLTLVLPLVAQTRTAETELETPLKNFRVETATEFLGSVGGKTVTRFRLTSLDIARALAGRGIHQYSLTLRGAIRDSSGAVAQTISYPLSGTLFAGQPLSFSFLRALAPGDFQVEIDVGTATKTYGTAKFAISVPEVGEPFRPEMAPNDYSTLPSAEAVILAAPNPAGSTGPAAQAPRVRINPPAREVPLGLLHLTATVLPPVVRIEFYLDDKLILTRTEPPYEVDIDLGKIPARHTIRAVGFDANGNLVDEDAYALNQGDARLAVRILPLATGRSTAGVPVRLAVQSINGGVAQEVDLYLDSKKIASFTGGPYETTIPAAEYAHATLLRATATAADGTEANDVYFLKGGRAVSEHVRVDVVQLHISALGSDGQFVSGLAENDFRVFEDGAPQKISDFEVARNLPINVGLVIDGSGSMRPVMNFVHLAGMNLFQDMIHEKDRGFVIQFREVPSLACPATNSVKVLVNAVLATEATGQTALYDSIVLGLYQFRATTGRKALIVISDGGDNHSWVDYATMLRYARTVAIPVYVIGVHIDFLQVDIRSKLKELASDTGGEAFFTSSAGKIPDIVKEIETELRSQYLLSYRTGSKKPEGEFRQVKVTVDKRGIKLRTIRGYVP